MSLSWVASLTGSSRPTGVGDEHRSDNGSSHLSSIHGEVLWKMTPPPLDTADIPCTQRKRS